MSTTARTDLAGRAAEYGWYHCVDLGDGVVTRGAFDTRATLDKIPFPKSFEGKRCLDVGTWDGFFAFEMERRGAASVTAVDVEDPDRWDWPPEMRVSGQVNVEREVLAQQKSGSQSFWFAHETLGSKVERVDMSVYDLSPETLGTFDFVFLGSLLLHLRDPVRALASLRTVCAGEALISDTVEFLPSILRPRTPTARLEGIGRPWWWMPNVAALRQMVRSAGFEILGKSRMYVLPLGPAHPDPKVQQPLRKLFTPAGREAHVINRVRGLHHAAVRARPLQAGAPTAGSNGAPPSA